MDDEMEVEMIYEAHEVDFDYEFDAPMFFEFSRQETSRMLRIAEEWFLDAPSYPPSPFVTKLLWAEQNGWLQEGVEDANQSSYCDTGREIIHENECDEKSARILSNLHSSSAEVCGQQFGVTSGSSLLDLSFQNIKSTCSSNVKPKLGISSTLMKPTASILAKQNQIHSRPRNHPDHKIEIVPHSVEVEAQASKRQKVEGGRPFKVGETKPQAEFLHKTSKKNMDTHKGSVSTKLRITIPRMPVLATTSRLQKRRTDVESKPVTLAEHGFKARPLNRKILEAPSFPLPKRSTPKLPEFQEFHLKTSERAMQHSSMGSSFLHQQNTQKGSDKPCRSSIPENGSRGFPRHTMPNTTRLAKCEDNHAFKTRFALKKISVSKGEISDVRNDKFESKVPPLEKRVQPTLELFNKLSLTSELQQNDRSQDSKENRFHPFLRDTKRNDPLL